MKRFLLFILLIGSISPLFAQLTGPVMKIANNTTCAKYVTIREIDGTCGNILIQHVVVPPLTTIAAFSSTTSSYFDAVGITDYSGNPVIPVLAGSFQQRLQGSWTICPIGYPNTATVTSTCTAPATTFNISFTQLYASSGSNAAYLIIG